MAGIWNGLRQVPGLGKLLRVTELLAKISKKLIEINGTLVSMQKKANGSLLAAIVSAIGAVAAAITAVTTATADPEPVSKFVLAASAIAAVGLAIIAIINVFEVAESEKKIKNLEKEMDRLRAQQRELEDLLEQLKREFGQ